MQPRNISVTMSEVQVRLLSSATEMFPFDLFNKTNPTAQTVIGENTACLQVHCEEMELLFFWECFYPECLTVRCLARSYLRFAVFPTNMQAAIDQIGSFVNGI